MYKLIICATLFFNSTFSIVDSTSTALSSGNNTLKVNDTCYVRIISAPSQSWIEKNAGALLGSFVAAFFAGIIAILSVYLTARSNKKQKEEREKEIYCGLLYAIKIELLYQLKIHQYLVQELEVIKHNSLLANEIIVENLSRSISLSFLQNIRNKIIESEIFNTNILLLLTAYINKCELVNSDINFDRLIKVNQKLKDKVNFPEATKSYFNIVIEQINNLEKSIPNLIQYLNSDLQLLGKTSNIDESKYFSQTN